MVEGTRSGNMSKAEYGAGSVVEFTDTRNGNKRWKSVIHIDGRQRTQKFPFTPEGKRAAFAWLREMAEQKKGNNNQHQQYITLTTAISEYIKNYDLPRLQKGQIKCDSYFRTLSTFNRIPASLLSMNTVDITKDDIKSALNQMTDPNYAEVVAKKKQKIVSNREINKALQLIKRVLRNEVANHRLPYNPAEFIDCEPTPKQEIEIFSKEEIRQLLSAVHYIKWSPIYNSVTHDFQLLLLILLFSGCRIGEALPLQIEDFDLTPGQEEMRIERNLDSHRYDDTKRVGLRITTVKGDKTHVGGRDGKRQVPLLSKFLIRKIRKLKAEGKTGYLFATKNGGPISYNNFYKMWQSICVETARECPKCHTLRPNDWQCKCGNRVTRRGRKCQKCGATRPTEWICPHCGETVREIHKKIHTTRHTACSILIELGTPITTVSKILGHASPDISLRIYSHASSTYMDDLRNLVNSIRTKNRTKIKAKE